MLGFWVTAQRYRGLDYPGRVPAPTPPTESEPRATGKGRPTPKRRDAEAARRRPLVPNRKREVQERRKFAREVREREYQAMVTGDERYMPARDKGPVRRWVRDYVDSRRNLGEYLLPLSIALVLVMFWAVTSPVVYLTVTALMYGVIIFTIVDGFVLGRRIKRLTTAKFGADKVPRGIAMYGVLRAFQIRRMRLPKPQVERGQRPK